MLRNAWPTTSGAAGGAERGAEARAIGYLETLRGLAVFLVVVYHAIGNDPSHGVHAATGTWPWWTARVFDLVQLPLFAYVSGRVFALPLGDDGRFARALWRKLVRLAVPLVVVTALFMVAMRVSGLGSSPGWVAAYTRSFEHLWYLQASLILMLVAAAATWRLPERPGLAAGGLLAVGVVGTIAAPPIAADLFSWHGALTLAPFFFLGRLVAASEARRPGAIEGGHRGSTVVLLAAVAAAGFAGWLMIGPPQARSTASVIAGLAVAFAVIGLFATLTPRWRAFEALAGASYTIYLLHPFLLAPTRMGLAKLWAGAPVGVVVAAGVVAGIVGPMLFHRLVVSRSPLAGFLFEGRSPHPERRHPAVAT